MYWCLIKHCQQEPPPSSCFKSLVDVSELPVSPALKPEVYKAKGMLRILAMYPYLGPDISSGLSSLYPLEWSYCFPNTLSNT